MLDVIATSEFQNITGLMIGVTGGILFWIALSAKRVDRYGREALAGGGLFMVVVALMRAVSLAGWVDIPTVRALNSMAAMVALVIIAQAGWLGHRNGKL